MSKYDEIELLAKELNRILINFRKGPNRNYLRSFLLGKQDSCTDLFNQIVNLLAKYKDEIEESEADLLQKYAVKNRTEIVNIINAKLLTAKDFTINKLKLYSHIIIFCKRLRSSPVRKEFKPNKLKVYAYIIIFCYRLKNSLIRKMAFDLKSASSLVEVYDGSPEKLDPFVDAATLLIELTPANNNATLFKFLKTRLVGKARQALNNVPDENPTTLVLKVQECCVSNITPESILAKLKASKQSGTTEAFCNEVDKLTNQLINVYVSDKVPGQTANKLACKAGIDALINGVNNPETKLILKAGNFKNINEAFQKVYENGQTSSNTATVLSYSARQSMQNKRGNGRGFSRGSQSYRGRNYHNTNHNSYFNHGNYHGRHNNDHPRRGRGGGGRFQYPRGGNSRIFYAQNQNLMNPPIMQQNQNPMLMQAQQHQQTPTLQQVNQNQPQHFLGTADRLSQF